MYYKQYLNMSKQVKRSFPSQISYRVGVLKQIRFVKIQHFVIYIEIKKKTHHGCYKENAML